jgi:thiamine-phosphate pyrophosphorylase
MQNRLHSMQLYAITDRGRLLAASQSEAVLRLQLLRLVEGWTAGGVHFIQLREKDLAAADLRSLAREIAEKIDHDRSRLLVNVSAVESAALAAAAGADGVHLAGKPTPGAALRARQLFRAAGRTADLDAIISVPCHTLEDIHVARREQVDLMLFSPVFEKLAGEKLAAPKAEPQGLEALRQACAAAEGIPIFALGGVTSINAQDCLTAGAAGVAGIRLFAADDWRRLLPPN